MGSDSIAHEAKGLIGYWLKGHEGERNNNYCFSKIQFVGQKKYTETRSVEVYIHCSSPTLRGIVVLVFTKSDG